MKYSLFLLRKTCKNFCPAQPSVGRTTLNGEKKEDGLILQNFKKPLDIFSPQIERKRSKEYLVIILAVKESFERFSCLKFIFEKSKRRELGLKHQT